MQEECVVKNIKGELATIILAKREQCNGCKGCVFGKDLTITRHAFAQVPVKKGDKVIVDMPQKQMTGEAVWLYIVPLLGLFIGLFIGLLFSELMGAILAILTCALSFAITYVIDKSYRKKKEFLPVIIAVISDTMSDTTK